VKLAAGNALLLVTGLLVIAIPGLGQSKSTVRVDSVSVLDAKSVILHLGVKGAERDSIVASIDAIQKLVDEDKQSRAEMREKIQRGEMQFSREGFQEVRARQEERQKKIDALAERIRKKFAQKQRGKDIFLAVPNLREMSRAERGEWRGQRQREGR
jgi:hypothetical protein